MVVVEVVIVVVEEMVVVVVAVVVVTVVTDIVVVVAVVTVDVVVADLSHSLVTDTGLVGIRRLRILSIGTSFLVLPFTLNTWLQLCPAFPTFLSAA